MNSFRFLGTEFLSELNEGSLWMRASMPLSRSLDESVKIADEMRRIIGSFREVKQVVSQADRQDEAFGQVQIFLPLPDIRIVFLKR